MIGSGILLFVRTECNADDRVVRVSGNESHCKNKSLTIFVMGMDVFAVVIVLLMFWFYVFITNIWTAF
jgi:hypothetical protein